MVFAWESAKFTLAVRDQIAPGTRMSMAIPYSSALVGSVLMLYYVIKNWWTGTASVRGEEDTAAEMIEEAARRPSGAEL